MLVMSYVFSGAETALTGMSIEKLHNKKLFGMKIKNKKIAENLYNKKEEVIGSILLGNTFANITASSLATELLLEFTDGNAVIIASFIMTMLILVFAELLPKTYSINHPEKAILFFAPIINVLHFILFPITLFVKNIVKTIFNAVHVSKRQEALSAADLLRCIIQFHKKNEVMKVYNLDIMDNFLDLSDIDIYQIIIHKKDVISIDIDLPMSEIIGVFIENKHSRVPVWEKNKDNIIGILHVKDIFHLLVTKGMDVIKASDIKSMLYEPVYVPATTNLSTQLNNFQKNSQQFGLVVNEYGDYEGIITFKDIIEEIVGDIYDEHEKEDNDIIKLGDDSYMIYGDVLVRDINRNLNWDLPEEQSSTLGGFVIYHAEYIPEEKEVFKFDNFRFVVLEKEKNVLSLVKISRL